MIDTPDFNPFLLYIQAGDSTEHTLGPRYVQIVVDRAFIEKLERRNAFCETDNLTECRENAAPRSWDESPGSANVRGALADAERVKHWQLLIDTDEFCFVGKNNGEVITESSMISTAGLSRWLHGAPEEAQKPEDIERDGESCYRLVGNVLVHAEEEMTEFVEMLRLCCPEFAAAVIEADMAARIGAVPQQPTAIAAAPRRTRDV